MFGVALIYLGMKIIILLLIIVLLVLVIKKNL